MPDLNAILCFSLAVESVQFSPDELVCATENFSDHLETLTAMQAGSVAGGVVIPEPHLNDTPLSGHRWFRGKVIYIKCQPGRASREMCPHRHTGMPQWGGAWTVSVCVCMHVVCK